MPMKAPAAEKKAQASDREARQRSGVRNEQPSPVISLRLTSTLREQPCWQLLVLFLGIKAILAVHAAGAVESEPTSSNKSGTRSSSRRCRTCKGCRKKWTRLAKTRTSFFEKRIAPNYSTIAEALGTAYVKNQVRLTRAQYTAKPSIDGLTELRIDANLSGDYTALMHFINDLERDKNHDFFIIDGLTFTGQQGGLVNLRLRLTTYLQANAGDQPPASDAPDSGEDGKRQRRRDTLMALKIGAEDKKKVMIAAESGRGGAWPRDL